jgi:hypothetical protein
MACVTLNSAIEAELPYLRTEAEAMYRDTFTVYSPTDDFEVDSDGFEERFYRAEGTTVGKIAGPSAQSRDTNARTVTVGGMELLVVGGGLHIPVSAPPR